MKKMAVLFLALVMILGSMSAMPMAASAEALTLPSGYTFVDIAHKTNADGSVTYVAAAKKIDGTNDNMKLYASKNGINWQDTGTSFKAINSANKHTQQQLVFWSGQNCFVAKGTDNTYTSEDGYTWVNTPNVHWSSTAVLTTNGEQLILAAHNSANVTSTKASKSFTVYAGFDPNDPYYAKVVGAKKPDENGKVAVLVDGNNKPYNLSVSTQNVWDKAATKGNSGATSDIAYDMVYNEKADQFLSVSEQSLTKPDEKLGKLAVASGAMSYQFYDIAPEADVTVTGVGLNENYVIVGKSNGKLYYTANTADGITADTVWTEIPVKSGATPCAEPMKNIEISADNSFLALSSTQIYKGSLDGYSNINEYKSVGKQYVAGGANNDMFKGVRLIGGAYSPSLGKYIVYGDTATKEQDDKYWGKIFESTDGINWENTYTGFTFSYRDYEQDKITIKSYEEAKNGAVWWGAQNQFIVSASTRDHEKTALVSAVEDGKLKWRVNADVDLKMHNDMAIAGGNKLYTLYRRGLWKYTEWSTVGESQKETIAVTKAGSETVSDQWYLNRLAVSDDNEPAVLMAQNGAGVVRRNTSLSATETDNWTLINNLGGAVLTDAIYSKSMGSFVGVLTTLNKVSIIGKDGTVEKGPSVASTVFNAVDTNDTDFMFAGADGKIYTAPDTADFAAATLTAVPAAAGSTENKMNVTNVFKAGTDTFIATATDNTNSDVLLIKKNGSHWSYTSTADAESIEGGLTAGSAIQVGAEGVNNTGDDYSFTLVAAVYAADDTLLQMKSSEHTITAGTSARVTMPMTLNSDLPANTKIKVFLWNSLTDMMPAAPAATNPF